MSLSQRLFRCNRLFRFCVGVISISTLGAIYAPQGARSQPHFPEDAISLMVPQFVAKTVRFKAIDETGYDSWGSDEVYAPHLGKGKP
jgi:hypothetical protein